MRPAAAQSVKLLALCAAATLTTGCFTQRPAKVCMQGNIEAATTTKIDNNVSPVCARGLPGEPCGAPRIALIDIDGLLVDRNLSGLQSMGENPVALFREKLQAAERDPCVAAVLLRVNSPGGGVTACDIMRYELAQFRQRSGKPVVACLMDTGAGGAYYIATAADVMVAHPTTITGGMGVILNLYLLKDMMAQNNIFSNVIRSGEKVDIGTPVREMSEEEAEILEGIAEEFHERLKSAVLASRPQLTPPASGAEEVPPPVAGLETVDDAPDVGVFDGRVFTGVEAQRLGLVDQLGYLEDALRVTRQLAGAPVTRTVVYRRNNDRALTMYDITPNVPGQSLVPVSIPGVDRALLPTFLYLWQPEPAYEKTSGP